MAIRHVAAVLALALPALPATAGDVVTRGGSSGSSSSSGSHHSGGSSGSSSSSSGGSSSGVSSRSPSHDSSGSSSHGSSSGVSSSSSRHSGSSSSSAGGSSAEPRTLSQAERRHPRPGQHRGGSYRGGYYGGYYGGYSGYYPNYWWGYRPYYPGYWYGWGPYWGFGYSWPYDGYPTAPYRYEPRDEGFAAIRLVVDPDDTRISLDGHAAGQAHDFDGATDRLRVSPGRHELVLERSGYRTERLTIFVRSGATLPIRRYLSKGTGENVEDLSGGRGLQGDTSPQPADRAGDAPEVESGRAQLQLSIQPADAAVYIDGEFQGVAEDVDDVAVAAGRHRIEVVRPGYATREVDIVVRPGAEKELRIDLEGPKI